MSFFDRFRTSTKPPKPESEQKTLRTNKTVYEATVHYRNGETEVIECYGITRGDTQAKFKVEPKVYPALMHEPSVTFDHFKRTVNYETLSREPTLEEIGTETYEITCTVEYEWDYKRQMRNVGKQWVGKVVDPSIELIDRDVSQ